MEKTLRDAPRHRIMLQMATGQRQGFSGFQYNSRKNGLRIGGNESEQTMKLDIESKFI
jgi:hypothetical protein